MPATLPLASLNANVTVVVPTGNTVEAVACAPPCGDGSTVSTAVAPASHWASAEDEAPEAPPDSVALSVIGAGAVTAGAVVSTTVTLKLAVSVRPDASDVEQATTVAPSGSRLPDTGVQFAGKDPSSASRAVAT